VQLNETQKSLTNTLLIIRSVFKPFLTDSLYKHIPSTYKQAHAIIQADAPRRLTIDVCPKLCGLLFRGDFETATECPDCKAPRYKPDSKPSSKTHRQPANATMQYLPLIPRLRSRYLLRPFAELLRYPTQPYHMSKADQRAFDRRCQQIRLPHDNRRLPEFFKPMRWSRLTKANTHSIVRSR